MKLRIRRGWHSVTHLPGKTGWVVLRDARGTLQLGRSKYVTDKLCDTLGVKFWCRVPFFAGVLALLVTGCASVRQEATTTVTSTNGVTTTMTVKSSVVASGDSKAVVDKLRASAGKTLSLGASGVSEESSLSTTLSALSEVLRATFAAGQAAAKEAKP